MNIDKLKQRNEELVILNTIAQKLNREVSLHKALESTLKYIVDLLNLNTGWIWLFENDKENSELAAVYNLPDIFLEQPQLLAGSCYCTDVYTKSKSKKALNISEITCSRLKGLQGNTGGLRYHASVPIAAHGENLGILNVLSPEVQRLPKAKLQLLYTVSDMLGIAIERARLFEQSKELGIMQERNRLARELHDTLAQNLTGIILRLETLDILLETKAGEGKIKKTLDQTLQLSRDNLQEIRRSVLDLRATALENQTLPEALTKLLKNIELQTTIVGTFEQVGARQKLPVRLAMGLYRIAQEAINNILQHAKAREIYIRLEFGITEIRLSIEDDGQGFDSARINHNRFGMKGLSERAKLLGGSLFVESTEGEGTRILAEIPMPK